LVNYQESVVQSIGTIGAGKLVQFVKGCWPSLAEVDLMFSKKAAAWGQRYELASEPGNQALERRRFENDAQGFRC
jgi:hypothetical protein